MAAAGRHPAPGGGGGAGTAGSWCCSGSTSRDGRGFKQVNDQLGHLAGDRRLAAAARRLQAGVREGDRVGRLGGDEFAIVLPGASADEAVWIAERLVADLGRPFDLPTGTGRTGASAGIAAAPAHAPAEQLLSSADTAMYEAKRAGKGRWVRAGT